MKRKISRKGLERKLQSLMREIVIIRDKKCVTCPIWRELLSSWNVNDPILQAGHYYSRGAKSIKYDLRNVHLQCKTCNARHRFQQEAFTLYLNRKFGTKWLDELTRDKYKLVPQSTAMFRLEILRDSLEMILKEEKGLLIATTSVLTPFPKK